MKKIILIIVALGAYSVKAQKIEESKFDKFDSVYTIKTLSQNLTGNVFSTGNLTFYVHWTDFKKDVFKIVPHKSTEISFIFKSRKTTSIDESTSSVKIEFVDGTVVQYNYFGRYHIISADDFASMTIQVLEENNPIYSKSIKSIRFSSSSSDEDFIISEKKANKIKETLALVKNEVEKINTKL